MARVAQGGFFAAHYDWIVAAAAAAALAAAGLFLFGAMGEDADEATAAALRRIEARRSDSGSVKPADLDSYQRMVKIARSPLTMGEISEKGESFMASGRRVFCSKAECRAPIPADVKICPVCGEKQPEKEVVAYDTDGDGMPDEWEKRYKLNPNDPADAGADADGDDFTNLEEFLAKTDPTDPGSHPDYLDSLRLVLPLKETMLPFYFRKHMKTPAGMKCEFFNPKVRNAYGTFGAPASAYEGQEIGDYGYVLKKFEQKTKKVRIKGGGEEALREVDVSSATIERKSDGKTIVLTVDEKRIPVDVQAKLVYERRSVKEFTVVAGDTLPLSGVKYVVKEIKAVPKGAEVTVEHETLGRPRTIQALEQ